MVALDQAAATLIIWAPAPGDVGGQHDAATAFAAHAGELTKIAHQCGFRSLEVIPNMHPDEESLYLCAEHSRPISAKEEIAFEEAVTSLTGIEAFGLAEPLRPGQREWMVRQYGLTAIYHSRTQGDA